MRKKKKKKNYMHTIIHTDTDTQSAYSNVQQAYKNRRDYPPDAAAEIVQMKPASDRLCSSAVLSRVPASRDISLSRARLTALHVKNIRHDAPCASTISTHKHMPAHTIADPHTHTDTT